MTTKTGRQGSIVLDVSGGPWYRFPDAVKMVPRYFDALQRRLERPGQYDPRVARVLSTPAPWDEGCDKTFTSANQ